MVGPPLCTCVLRSDVRARTRLVTEPAAALVVSGEASPEDKEALMGEVSVWGAVTGVAAGCCSATGEGGADAGATLAGGNEVGAGGEDSGAGGKAPDCEAAGGEAEAGGGVVKMDSFASASGRLISGGDGF
jgi:hypothetical protein